jgi:exoribonuclease R
LKPPNLDLEIFYELRSSSAEIVLEDDGFDPGDTLEDESTKQMEVASKSRETTPTGKVVAIVRRKWRQYCGMLQPNPMKGSLRQIFVPAEKKIPKVRLETRQVAWINLFFKFFFEF